MAAPSGPSGPAMMRSPGRRIIFVKISYDDQVKRIPGTSAQEEHGPSSLVVYDGLNIVARFLGGVERWWIEEA